MYQRQVSYDNANNRISSETVTALQAGGDTYRTVTSYDYDGLSNNQYALGQAFVVDSDISKLNGSGGWTLETRNRTVSSYIWRDGALQGSTSFDPDRTGGSTLHTTTFGYNASGHLNTVSINDGDPRTITYKNDVQGQILQRKETGSDDPGNVRDIYYRLGGAELGHIGNSGSVTNTDYSTSIFNRTQGAAADDFQFNQTEVTTPTSEFGQGADPVNSYSAGTQNGSYTVRGGDTLQSIAAGLWGDASLWYKLAEANGLRGGQPLAAGTTLHVPHGVQRSSFNAATFQTYDPTGAVGDTSPTTPQPPKNNKCGVLGQIFLVAIAIAVSAVTYGALTGASTTFIGAVAAGAVSGAAGSIASQAVGVATGIQDSFSWKQVGLAAIAGGVGGGLGKLGDIHKGLKGISDFFEKQTFVSGAARGVTSNVITQGIGIAAGLKDNFSFTGVAVAGIVNGIGTAVSAELPGAIQFNEAGERIASASITNQLVSGAAGAIAGAATRSALKGTNFGDNLIAVIPDVVGSTIGRLALEGIAGLGRGTHENGESDKTVETDTTDGPGARAAQARMLSSRLSNIQFGGDGYYSGSQSAAATRPAEPLGDQYATKGQEIVVRAEALSWWDKAEAYVSALATTALNNPYTQDYVISPYTRISNTLTYVNAANNVVYDRYIAPNIDPAKAWFGRQLLKGVGDAFLGPAGGQIASDVSDRNAIATADGFIGSARNLVRGALYVTNVANPLALDPGAQSDKASFVNGIGALYNRVSSSPLGIRQLSVDTVVAGANEYNRFQSLDTAGKQEYGFRLFGALTFEAGATALTLGGNRIVSGGRVVSGVDDFVGPRIGKSGYKTSEEFAAAVERKYQGFVNEAYPAVLRAERRGLLSGNQNTRVGAELDRVSAQRLDAYLKSEGISEGPNGLIQLNRWLRDPAGSGKYVRPDVRIPAANRIFDATIGNKSYNSSQLIRFDQYSRGDYVTLIRPDAVGGSYSVVPRGY